MAVMPQPKVRADAPAVLHVVPRLEPDQRTRSVLDIGRALKEHGWRSAVATTSATEREHVMAGEDVVLLPLEGGGVLRPWRNAHTLTRIIRQQRAVLVHAHGRALGPVAEAAARRAGVPMVLSPDPVLDETAARREPLAGDLILASSEHMADELAQEGADLARLRVVPPWIDMREMDPALVRGQRVAAIAERFGLHVGPRIVAVPTELAVGQGRTLLTEALAKLPYDDYVLLLLGAMPEGRDQAEPLLKGLRALGLEERVRFALNCPDLPAALMLVDVLLVPATKPLPAARLVSAAQAMGKPAIVTSVGALPELVMPAVTGWVLPPDQPGEVAWAIDLAFRMEHDTCLRVARRAREFAGEGFAAAPLLAHVIELYAALAGTRPSRLPLAKAG